MLNRLLRIISISSIMLLSIACDNSGSDSPEIRLVGLNWSNEQEAKNIENLQKMPELKAGDTVEIELLLSGKGNPLRSFQIIIDDENVNGIVTGFTAYREEDVFNDENFTDFDNGTISFVDDVIVTQLTVSVQIIATNSEELTLSFYLSAKADCEAGVMEAEFRLNN